MRLTWPPVLGALLLAGARATVPAAEPPTPAPPPDAILACGEDQVRRYESGAGGMHETWRWSARGAAALPEAFRTRLLAHIDDCKPVSGAAEILVTASTGGVLLLEAASGAVAFHAIAPMAHSAALLPGRRIAIALSVHAQGDRVQVYDVAGGRLLLEVPAPSAHGTVWDERRERLFVLSHDLLQEYALEDWQGPTPALRERRRWDLPGRRNGHDLSAAPDGGYLVTTQDGAWRFVPEEGRFRPLPPPFNPALDIKAINADAAGRLAFVKAEESWWAHGFTITEAGRDLRVTTDGLRLYKVRWVPGAQDGEHR